MGTPSALGADEAGRSQFTDAVQVVAMNSTSVAVISSQLVVDATYLVACDNDCFWLQGTSAVAPTATTGVPLWAKMFHPHVVLVRDIVNAGYIGGVLRTAGTGNLYIIRIR